MIHEVRVSNARGLDVRGQNVLDEVESLGISGVTKIRTVTLYRIEGLSRAEADLFARTALVESVNEKYSLNTPLITDAETTATVEVSYKPGVMNPEVESLMKAAHDIGLNNIVAVDSSVEYHFYGTLSKQNLRRILEELLVNKVVQRVVTENPQTLLITGQRGDVSIIPIRSLDDKKLMELSEDKLFLNLEEMKIIQVYFKTLGRDPTDVELETLAQTWSEHCGHKTFGALLTVNGKKKAPLMDRLKAGTAQHGHGIISAFHDNAGVFAFYNGFAICIKVETHNSPSAIEPYGGSETGIGGVVRDAMGTGEGAKVILSTDIFCLGPPNLPNDELPVGCLHPKRIFKGVVAGVRDYGNRLGIPTGNGSVYFDNLFRAKPSIIVGTCGIIPADRALKGQPRKGHLIVVVGGKTGRDGIHGATFSSGIMTERTVTVHSSAVQIGNAIEERRMSVALLQCRDEDLIEAITDCGAAGLSSAIGEMGEKTGVCVELDKAPLKYLGLAPWEIWISESQERMVIAVAPENIDRFLEICEANNVEATVLGEFTDSHRLVITYEGEVVCDLDMEFLHNGLPQREMTANWTKPAFETPNIPIPVGQADWVARCYQVLGHGNVCSKEPIVRMYDHEVQGASVLKPFSGVNHDGPNDAAVLAPLLGKPYGLVASHGLHPVLNLINPYWGSIWAAVEALANLVAVGGNIDETWLVDNFIWPFPNEQSLGALDMAVDALAEIMRILKTVFISGKDSLSSTFVGKDGTIIEIPPVMCIHAFGKIPDVMETVSSDFKRTGSYIVLLGDLNAKQMGGSVYLDTHGFVGNNLPKVNIHLLLNRFRRLYQLIQKGDILSCKDVSQGGAFTAVAEMCFGGEVGSNLDLSKFGTGRPDFLAYNEMAGCLIVEVTEEALNRGIFDGLSHSVIGKTKAEPTISVTTGIDGGFTAYLDALKYAWQAPMREVFHS